MYVAAFWKLSKMYLFNSGPDAADPQKLAGNGRNWRPRTPQRTAQRSKRELKTQNTVHRSAMCTSGCSIALRINTKNTKLQKWIHKFESTIMKAIPEDTNQIKILDPFLGPPLGRLLWPLFRTQWALFGFWAAAGSESQWWRFRPEVR